MLQQGPIELGGVLPMLSEQGVGLDGDFVVSQGLAARGKLEERRTYVLHSRGDGGQGFRVPASPSSPVTHPIRPARRVSW